MSACGRMMAGVQELSIAVTGLPPAKNEAKSMLAAGHGHSPRVLALLQAVQEAVTEEELLFPAESLGMELVVTSPAVPPSDATNYLGGVADVLEDKAHRGDLTHLGPLAKVALYGKRQPTARGELPLGCRCSDRLSASGWRR